LGYIFSVDNVSVFIQIFVLRSDDDGDDDDGGGDDDKLRR